MEDSKKYYTHLPQKPGVYLFRDGQGKVLYVGKAINLRNRVKSYFDNKHHDLRILKLLNTFEKIDHLEAGSNLEALLLEARLIKEYRPYFNVRLKDNKRYLYVGLTKEEYPRVILLRQPERTDNLLDWFGPFPSSGSLKQILRMVRRIFPYRTCLKLDDKPCFYYHLGLCPGMCVKSVKNYKRTVNKIRLLLRGEISKLSSYLEKQMETKARRLDFEEAEMIKHQLALLKELRNFHTVNNDEGGLFVKSEELRVLLTKKQGFEAYLIKRIEGYDISNLGEKIIVGSMVVFTDGAAENGQYRQFKIRSLGQDDPGAIKQVLQRRLRHEEWVFPQVILIDGGKTQLTAAFEALKERGLADNIGLLGLTKQKEIVVIPRIVKEKIVSWEEVTFTRNSGALQLLQSVRDEAHRFAQRYYKKLHTKVTFSSGTK